MPLKAVLDSIEDLPEDIQKEYEQREDGKFVLKVEPSDGFELSDIKNLRSALEKERDAQKQLSKKVKEFESKFADLDPDKAREALKKIQEGEKALPEIDVLKKQYSEKEKQLIENFNQEKQKLTGKVDALFSQLKDATIRSEAVKAITSHKGSVELLLPHVISRTKLTEDNGKFKVDILGDGDVVRVSKKDPNRQMDIAELVEEMKSNDTFMPAFSGSGNKGADAKGSGRTAQSGKQIVLTAKEAADVRKYRAAKAEAEKTGKEIVIKE